MIVALCLAALAAPAAAADIDALIGRRLTDVRLVAAGTPVDDGSVLALVETRVGEPLVMAEVRQTIDHLVTLGRYADIRVYGEADGDGVRLRYGLVPLERIVRVRFDGPLALDEAMLRSTLTDQLGATPARQPPRRDGAGARGPLPGARLRVGPGERRPHTGVRARRGGGRRQRRHRTADPGRPGHRRG